MVSCMWLASSQNLGRKSEAPVFAVCRSLRKEISLEFMKNQEHSNSHSGALVWMLKSTWLALRRPKRLEAAEAAKSAAEASKELQKDHEELGILSGSQEYSCGRVFSLITVRRPCFRLLGSPVIRFALQGQGTDMESFAPEEEAGPFLTIRTYQSQNLYSASP